MGSIKQSTKFIVFTETMGMRNNAPESSYFVKKPQSNAPFYHILSKESWAQEVATTGIATTATIVNATHTHTYTNT